MSSKPNKRAHSEIPMGQAKIFRYNTKRMNHKIKVLIIWEFLKLKQLLLFERHCWKNEKASHRLGGNVYKTYFWWLIDLFQDLPIRNQEDKQHDKMSAGLWKKVCECRHTRGGSWPSSRVWGASAPRSSRRWAQWRTEPGGGCDALGPSDEAAGMPNFTVASENSLAVSRSDHLLLAFKPGRHGAGSSRVFQQARGEEQVPLWGVGGCPMAFQRTDRGASVPADSATTSWMAFRFHQAFNRAKP